MRPDISGLNLFSFPRGPEFPFCFVAMDHWAQFPEGYSISPLLATRGYSYWIERLLNTIPHLKMAAHTNYYCKSLFSLH